MRDARTIAANAHASMAFAATLLAVLVQIRISHQTFIHFPRHLAAFPDTPYHQGLPSVHVTCGKYLIHIGTVVAGLCLHVGSAI